MTSDIPVHGPGIMYVLSSLSSAPGNQLTESAFNSWYIEEHMPEIIATSGMPNAFRNVHVDKSSPHGTSECPKPFLAFYPMKDLAFTQSEAFRKIRVKSDRLPGTGVVFDMADFDIGYYGLVSKSGEARGTPRFFATAGVAVGDEVADGDVEAGFDRQTAAVSQTENYIHSRRFKLQYSRTNAQSRALKGLVATGDGSNVELPTWLAIHSFSAEPSSDVRKIIETESNDALRNSKQFQIDSYRSQSVQGQGRIFDTDEDGIV
ncbi:unnamed protein product [Periconia digitata]|uniref:EthD domain-containing protein n=1 Tax=Periconia digitata TaxID=1303443 RepID=A0A9W4USM6_9PLEO|nr:unnamed protein product [Periconia digitata]